MAGDVTRCNRASGAGTFEPRAPLSHALSRQGVSGRGLSSVHVLNRLVASVLMAAAASGGALAAPKAANASSTLTPFYRSTQLQGHLFGMGLMAIPDYLLAPDLAFPYRRKPGFPEEIPFVDSFSINRVMGGYREDWLKKFGRFDPALGRRSLDYAVRGANGALTYRPELIRQRLKPYLDAGYRPGDITLALDNTPWDLKTPNGAPPEEGAWGRKTPPGDLAEWSAVVEHLASDLKAYLGPAANDLTFETGVEYDERASFDGDAQSYFRYYEATDRAIHTVLPRARFGPGEFTALGQCSAANPACVYDTRDLLDFARRRGLTPDFVPRSLHALDDKPHPEPSAAAARLAQSYARLPPVVEEVHQFGLLFEPFGETLGGDVGPMQANWEFQTLVRLMAAGPPRRVFHWGGFTSVGRLQFLNGSGFLRLVLDHYLGRRMDAVPVSDSPERRSYPAETLGVVLTGAGGSALMLSSFSERPSPGVRQLSVALPPDLLKSNGRFRIVRYRAGEDVFSMVRRDLAAEGNLRPEFARCELCEGAPIQMANDAARARVMIQQNWPRYQSLIQSGLRWRAAGDTIRLLGRSLQVEMGANDLLIVEPQ